MASASLADQELERALISIAMVDATAWSSIADIIERDDFSSVERGQLFGAIGSIVAAGREPDPTLLRSKLPTAADEIEACRNAQAVAGNVLEYAERVRRLAELRQLQATCDQMRSAINDAADPEHIASQGMERLLGAITRADQSRQTLSYGHVLDTYVDKLEEEKALRDSGKSVGIHFDFPPIDDYMHGMRPEDGDTIIIAGPPGSGKTAVSMSLLRRFALIQSKLPQDQQVGSLMMSLEMGRYATAMRWSQMVGGLTTKQLRSSMTQHDIDHLRKQVASESKLPLYVNFKEGLFADQIKAIIANEVLLHNVKIVVIDHLKYVNMRQHYRDENVLDEMRARYLKEKIAKPLGVALIVLAHTIKAPEGREDKTPQMSDLRGSGQVAAAVDGIAFVHRPITTATRQEIEDGAWAEDEAYLVWRKNRNAALEKPRFVFKGDTMRIEAAGGWGKPPSQPAVHIAAVEPDRIDYEFEQTAMDGTEQEQEASQW